MKFTYFSASNLTPGSLNVGTALSNTSFDRVMCYFQYLVNVDLLLKDHCQQHVDLIQCHLSAHFGIFA